MRRAAGFLVSMTCLLCAVPAAPGAVPDTVDLQWCLDQALANNLSLKVAEEKVRESTAGLWQARAAFLPHLTAQASYTRLDEAPYMDMSQMGDMFAPLIEPFMYLAYRDPANPDTGLLNTLGALSGAGADGGTIPMGSANIYGLTFTAQQPLFTGLRVYNGLQAAKNGVRASEENLRRSRRDLVLSVKKSYYGILQAQRYAEVTDTSIRQLEAIVKNLQDMKEQGMVGEQDVMKARVQLYSVQQLRLQSRNGVELATSALCTMLGLPLETGLPLARAIDGPEQPGLPDLAALIDKAAGSQEEIRAMEFQVAAMRNLVNTQRANYLPSIVALGNYHFRNPNREYEEEFYGSWDVTLALQMNLFDWGDGWQKRKQAQSQFLQAQNALEQLRDGVALTVKQNYLSAREAFEKIAISAQAREQAEASYAVMYDRFTYGMATNADLLEMQRTLTQAKIDHYNNIVQYHVQKAQLEHLLD